MKEVLVCLVAIMCLLCFSDCNTSPSKSKDPEKLKVSATDSIEVKLEMVSNAIEAPVELNVPGDGSQRKFITDNSGKIWILQNDTLVPKPFFNIHDKLGKQEKNSPIGSISSVAFHPRFSTNNKFYVCYNAPSGINAKGGKLVVSEFSTNTNNPDRADLESEYRVFEMEGINIGANLAQILFGPDGYLYISVGDDKIGDSAYLYHAQDLDHFNGKLLRIDVDMRPYAIPSDNPYVNTKNAKPEIWASGFRKMWRYSFDPETDQLFGGDVGELQEEEINIVKKGSNYGWPLKEGKSVGDKPDSNNTSILTSPIYNYPRNVGICIIGGHFYHGKGIPPLNEKYVFADFNGSIFALIENDKDNWTRIPVKIVNKPGGVLLICGLNVDENNELFVLGFLNSEAGSKGVVYKMVKA